MESLQEIYQLFQHGCDKGTRHSYIEVYESLLEPFRCQPVTVLELGVSEGASLALWANYFTSPMSRIIGIDVADKRSFQSRAIFVSGNATSADLCSTLPACDIVIDDASHYASEQSRSFGLLWSKVNPGGLYVIEDVQNDSSMLELVQSHPEFEVMDRRSIKGRYDDILMIARKPIVTKIAVASGQVGYTQYGLLADQDLSDYEI